MEARDARAMSYAAYVAAERVADVKHEYVNGRVYAMAGGTPEHARLAAAIAGELRAGLRGRPCAVFSSDLRVRIAATGRATYPDVTVVCGQLQGAFEDPDAIENPVVIVEVLSPNTEADDRGGKWAHYQRVATLREYVLVNQGEARIEVYSRDPVAPERWLYREFGPGAAVTLPSLELTLAVDDLYRDPLAAG